MQAVTSSKRLLALRMAAAIAFFAAGAGLFVLGARPMAVGLFNPPWDKLAHVATFTLIACAAGIASGRRGWFRAACCVAGALVIGAVDELHQMYLPGRSASWADLLADAIGGIAGAGLLHLTPARWWNNFKNR